MRTRIRQQSHLKARLLDKTQYNSRLAGSKLTYAGYASLGIIGLVGLATIFPVAGKNTNAAEQTAVYREVQVAAEVAPTLSVSLGNSHINMDVIPTADGTFSYNSTTLSIVTNNETGYKVYLSTNGGSTDLTSVNTAKTDKIVSIATDTIGANFEKSTWGFALQKDAIDENSTYKAIPSNLNDAIESTQNASSQGADVYQLGFGTKIGPELASGEYKNSVVVSVVTNPQNLNSLEQLVYMQDMTKTICDNTNLEYTKQLTDVRDGKKYWVAKLADGNCWMTQNLALDLAVDPRTGNTVATRTNSNGETVATTTLGVGNTNLESLVSPTNQFGFWQQDLTEEEQASTKLVKQTETEIPEKGAGDNRAARSWNLGEIVLNNPTESADCGAIANVNTLETNACQWYTNVSSYTATNEGWSATNSVDTIAKTYDSHYLIGNYYQWNAAAAGTGVTTDNSNTDAGFTDSDKLIDATSSICPKGWQLPTSGAYNNTKNDNTTVSWPYMRAKSFIGLLTAYGYPDVNTTDNTTVQPNGWHISSDNARPYTSLIGEKRLRVDYIPMYFVKSGVVNPSLGTAYDFYRAYYWSSTAYPNNFALSYAFDFDRTNVYPASRRNRHVGLSVRCISQ